MYYTQEQIDRANQADLVSFLQSQGEQLTRAGNEYRWKRHDSLTVRGNKWYRHSQSKGGAPIDFVMEFFGKSFTEAVELLTGEQGAAAPDRPSPAPLSDFRLPPRSDTAGQVKSYLISQLLRNPIYAQADLDMYEFFKSQGTVVVNEATDFAGTNGCYLYQGRDVQERKNKHLKDQILVLAPSEGLVSSDTWLRCRKKLMANKTFQGGRKAKNTWLAGKVKCGRCGYALMSVGNPTGVQYLRCSKRADSKSCDGCGTLRTREFERFLYGEMVKKLSEFQTLTAKRETVNPKLTALNMELARVEDEIEKLLNTLTGANAVLLSYANSKIEELDTRRQALTKEIAALSAETMSPEQIERLSVYLNQWEEIDFEDRRQVADGLISQIRATDEHVSIEWKI